MLMIVKLKKHLPRYLLYCNNLKMVDNHGQQCGMQALRSDLV